jgi:hypothetical protein
MKKIKSLFVAIVILVALKANAQDYKVYQASDAVMLQVNGDIRTESILKKAVVSLSNGSNELNIRLYIPYSLINYQPPDTAVFSSAGTSFDVKLNINSWQIQDEITSVKLFKTEGYVTLNNITNPVIVEYIPLPAGSDNDGIFNLSMTIKFRPADFKMDDQHTNSNFIIKISNVRVNRL